MNNLLMHKYTFFNCNLPSLEIGQADANRESWWTWNSAALPCYQQ